MQNHNLDSSQYDTLQMRIKQPKDLEDAWLSTQPTSTSLELDSPQLAVKDISDFQDQSLLQIKAEKASLVSEVSERLFRFKQANLKNLARRAQLKKKKKTFFTKNYVQPLLECLERDIDKMKRLASSVDEYTEKIKIEGHEKETKCSKCLIF